MLWSVAWLEACRFFKDECLEGLFGQVVELHVELERSLGDRLVNGKRLAVRLWAKWFLIKRASRIRKHAHLIGWVVVLLQIGMCQGLLHLNPLMGVKGQHFIQQIQRWTRREREKKTQ